MNNIVFNNPEFPQLNGHRVMINNDAPLTVKFLTGPMTGNSMTCEQSELQEVKKKPKARARERWLRTFGIMSVRG